MLHTLSPAAFKVWVSIDCTTQPQSPSRAGRRLWGHRGPSPGPPMGIEGHARRGSLLALARRPARPQTFLSLGEASNARGANPGESGAGNTCPRAFSGRCHTLSCSSPALLKGNSHRLPAQCGERLDAKSPERFGCLQTKRSRDGGCRTRSAKGQRQRTPPCRGTWEPSSLSPARSSSSSRESCLCSSAWRGACGKRHNPQKGRVLIK